MSVCHHPPNISQLFPEKDNLETRIFLIPSSIKIEIIIFNLEKREDFLKIKVERFFKYKR